jgi:hypothetical protein
VAMVLTIGLISCTHPTGTVSGRLVAVGGPPGLRPRPLPGTVEVTGPETRSVTVGNNGIFQIEVETGPYTVVGHSLLYNGGTLPCRPRGAAVVHEAERRT